LRSWSVVMMHGIGRFAASSLVLGAAISLAACGGGSGSTVPQALQNAGGSAIQQSIARADVYASWRSSLSRAGLPGAGCFYASYPAIAWSQIACSTPPNLLYPLTTHTLPAQGITPSSTGNGNDYTAQVAPRFISTAAGAFPTVSGVTSVKSVGNPAYGDGGELGKNSYTLQLNSSFFSTAACGDISNCLGWEQFVYENPPGSTDAELFIQDWLVPTTSSGLSGCPPDKGWTFADGGCVQDSPTAIAIPNQKIADLGTLVETGAAASSGDSVFLLVGSTMYGMKVQKNGITDLSEHWQGAEFDVIGNAGGSIARFNAGVTISISLQTDTGVSTAPSCPADTGTTAESNNLSFKKAPSSPAELKYPSILFTESNLSGGGKASCDMVSGTGT
jgi:hypothetical protein